MSVLNNEELIELKYQSDGASDAISLASDLGYKNWKYCVSCSCEVPVCATTFCLLCSSSCE
ncbi:hypothetical protein [Halobacteriovorax sp. CON-3]|uniref:hypothetical protein n=1 Tax=Halobacteriovorax sp. CON-3 TaxID=3157710 RepID=UPI00371DB810